MSGGDIAVSRADIGKAMRQAILPIWNAYYFFTLYANIDGVKAKARTDQKGVLDRYILAKTREMIAAVEERLDHYDLPGAYAAVPPFIEALEQLVHPPQPPAFLGRGRRARTSRMPSTRSSRH